MIKKRLIMRILFTVEVVLFSWFYYYGICGIREINALYQENRLLEDRISCAYREIEQKEQEVHSWESDPFCKEKLAREQLHMAKEGEEIYLIGRSQGQLMPYPR